LELTVEIIAKIYSSMFDSEDAIYKAINSSPPFSNFSPEEKLGIVKDNVRHLELTMAKDIWNDEDMSTFVSSVTDGNEYIADNS
jgi:hypothetical protein